MKKRKLTQTQQTIARLRAWRDRLRGGGKNRKQRTTPHAYAFSKNAAATPKREESNADD